MSASKTAVSKITTRRRDSSSPGRRPVASLATTGLFVLAMLYTADVASSVIIPITIGFLLSMILATPVRRLVAWRIPRPVASAVMIVLVIIGIGLPVMLLSEPASTWLKDMPNNASELAERIEVLTTPIQDVKDVAEEVEKMATLDDGVTDKTPVVKVAPPGVAQTLLDSAPSFFASTLFAVFLAYLLLCSGDAMLRKIIAMVCAIDDDKKRALVITKQIQADLFRYLAAVTTVNLLLGVATAGILYLLDVPNALLWGGVAALLNYAPLVGPAITIGILAMVGITTFENTGQALMVPFSYFILTSIEGQVISPTVIGRRLALSPVVVLISLVTLGWMWGFAGLILAVPIISSTRIICANIPRLNSVAVILGRETDPPAEINR